MKSVLQAGWLLTVAVGNIIVLIVAEAATLDDQVGGFYFILFVEPHRPHPLWAGSVLLKRLQLNHCLCVCPFNQWAEYILFASLLVVVSVIFAVMAYFYTYIDPTMIEAQFAEIEPEEKDKQRSYDMPNKELVENHNEVKQKFNSSDEDSQTRM